MTIRTAVSLLLAYAFAAVPAAATPTHVKTVAVAIARTAGTCPAIIAIKIANKQYEGGYTLEVTAQTMSAAYVSELLSATAQRITFDADLRPAYASCEGSGPGFALHRGKLSYVVTPGKGPNGTPPKLLDVSVDGGTPHVKMAFAD